jgi:stage V sporulation protein SpoVS
MTAANPGAKAAGETAAADEPVDYDAAVHEIIAMCDGDARQAVKVLLIAQDFLERELELARVAVSHGYSRGWHARRARED